MSTRRMLSASSCTHVDANGMITDSWDKFISNCKKYRAQEYYEVGNYIPLDMGEHGILNMEIMAFFPPFFIYDEPLYPRCPNVFLYSKELTKIKLSVPSGSHDICPYFMINAETSLFPLIPSEVRNNIPVVLSPFYGAGQISSSDAIREYGREPLYSVGAGEKYLKGRLLLMSKAFTLNIKEQFEYHKVFAYGEGTSLLRLHGFIKKDFTSSDRIKYLADGSGPYNYATADVFQDSRSLHTSFYYYDSTGNIQYRKDSFPDIYLPLGFCL